MRKAATMQDVTEIVEIVSEAMTLGGASEEFECEYYDRLRDIRDGVLAENGVVLLSGVDPQSIVLGSNAHQRLEELRSWLGRCHIRLS